ncbi:MAG: hypothetical protein LPK19_00170, partial [Hymenobacteraceae bacterium]|nr:hypothetical protein [Hymenobacteraceae bacterium]MDX5394582.1 hypothetical protein [Hymenobacteraceae bacterium]MDX5510608.1 hypothetical protein [Hymenobacteraceae bacterium]
AAPPELFTFSFRIMAFRNIILFFYLALLPILYSFSEIATDHYYMRLQPQLTGTLPPQVSESSGLALADTPGTFWTHNDAGGGPDLYKIDTKGNLLQTLRVPKADNVDWEDLAQDSSGNLYIGDVGNNHCRRQNLCIYKFNPLTAEEPEQIRYSYPDQPDYKLSEDQFNFDCEAMFWHENHIYLISKDRGKGQTAKLYRLPDQPGEFTAELVDSCKLNTMITGADISPDGKKLALLSNTAVYLVNLNQTGCYFGDKRKEIVLGASGKTEAVVFADNQTIYFTNEQGNLYLIKL